MTALPLLAALLAGPADGPPPVRLEGAAMVWSEWDFENIPATLDRAVADGSRRILFVVTAHAKLAPTEVPNAYAVAEIGFIEKGDGDGTFAPLAGAARAKWVDLLAAAFKAAADRDLAVSILPHLDAHGELQAWRNQFDFDPRATVGTGAAACSYQSAMIDACVEALHAAVPTGAVNGEPVEFNLAGEMGRTVFAHPNSWMAVLEGLREDPRCANWELGFSFNHDGVTGGVAEEELDADAMNRLLGACDFLGISHYRPVSVPPTPADYARGIETFAAEFAALGAPLPAGIMLHISEIGLGGGGRGDDGAVTIPAEMLADAARAPYLGTTDLSKNPWADDRPAFVRFRRDALAALLGYLSGAADGNLGGLPRATRCHLWSMGSWDPLGWRDVDFRDETIAVRVRNHNETAE